MRHWTRIGLCLVALGGCQEDWTEDYAFVWRSENVDVYAYDLEPDAACRGSMWAVEAQTRSVMDYLDVPSGEAFTYRWMSFDFWEGMCPGGAACTDQGVPFARTLPEMHEIVHMVAYRAWNTCPQVLEEGLAEYLSDPRPYDSPLEATRIEDVLTVTQLPGRAYRRAGHFVAFLNEEYGEHVVKELCAELPEPATRSEWERAAIEVLDERLDTVLDRYAAYPACSLYQYRARRWECSGAPDFTFGVDGNEFEFEANCADPRAMSSNREELVVTRRIEFLEDTTVSVFLRPAFAPIVIDALVSQECTPCSRDPQVFRYRQVPQQWTFRAGVHTVSVFVDAGSSQTVGVSLLRSEPS